tara:strand:+ start:5191 stop:6096 length:906 start_codon:yes stop_codon:yes gene_type:complete
MNYFLYTLLLSFTLFSQDRSTLFSTGNPPELGVGWDIKCNEFYSTNTGDVNNDDNIDVLDVVTIVGFILGNNTPTDEEFDASDTNLDFNIDVLDVVIIVNIILNGSTTECASGLSGAVKFTSNNEYTFEAFSVIFETGDLEGDGLFEVRLHHDDFFASAPGEVIGSWELTLDENMAREYYVFTGDTDCITLTPFSSYWLSVHPINNIDEALWLFSEGDYTHSMSNDMGNSWSNSELDQVGCTKIFGEQIYESSGTQPDNELVYDWALEDLNINSEYFGQDIGPSTFINNQHVSVYYFGKAG